MAVKTFPCIISLQAKLSLQLGGGKVKGLKTGGGFLKESA
jgi:hypothetical protein